MFPFPLLAVRRLYGALADSAGRFEVGVVVVFFGVGVGSGVAVETERLRHANLAGAVERATLNAEDELMQHLAALPADAMVCGCVRSEALSQGSIITKVHHRRHKGPMAIEQHDKKASPL